MYRSELNQSLKSLKFRFSISQAVTTIFIIAIASIIPIYFNSALNALVNSHVHLEKLNEIKDTFQLKIFSLEEKWINSEKKLKNDLEILINEKSKLNEKRTNLLQKLDPKILKLYETFISKNRTNGISKLENRISTCCKIELPNAFIEKIKKSEIPIICNCGKSLISE